MFESICKVNQIYSHKYGRSLWLVTSSICKFFVKVSAKKLKEFAERAFINSTRFVILDISISFGWHKDRRLILPIY